MVNKLKTVSAAAMRTVENFERLPKTARVSGPAFQLLDCSSRTSFWRKRRNGTVPPPIAGTCPPMWEVEVVRGYLSGNFSRAKPKRRAGQAHESPTCESAKSNLLAARRGSGIPK